MTLAENIERIKNECAEISSQMIFEKSIKEKIAEIFPTITSEEYQACEAIWDNLYREKARLQNLFEENNRMIQAVEAIIARDIIE